MPGMELRRPPSYTMALATLDTHLNLLAFLGILGLTATFLRHTLWLSLQERHQHLDLNNSPWWPLSLDGNPDFPPSVAACFPRYLVQSF